jgi:hypothetical protein
VTVGPVQGVPYRIRKNCLWKLGHVEARGATATASGTDGRYEPADLPSPVTR